MKIKLAARKSDLARIQAFSVGEALKKHHQDLEIEYLFRSSLGDINLTDPLWKMPDKGVFTNDFYHDLVANKVDLVVHSWKDLPIEERKETLIAATLPRADARDLLLVRQEWSPQQGLLKILSSSPRRSYNLSRLLPEILPGKPQVQFVDVRGNVLTRIKKVFEKSGEVVDAIIVAKAAIDRLLSAQGEEFLAGKTELQALLAQMKWMVLPLSENPTAAAQGALAIEVRRDRKDIIDLLSPIHCATTWESVLWERQRLAELGGGCHQKLGASHLCLKTPSGESFVRISVQGQKESGEIISELQIFNRNKDQALWQEMPHSYQQVYPSPEEPLTPWFERTTLPKSLGSKGLRSKDLGRPADETCDRQMLSAERPLALMLARSNVWTKEVKDKWGDRAQVLWCSGVRSWKSLALQGVWINGCQEGLGSGFTPRLEPLAGHLFWLRLTHDKASDNWTHSTKESTTKDDAKDGNDRFLMDMEIPLYQLEVTSSLPNLAGKKFFFWMSGSQFEMARKHFSEEINQGYHACGPGRTYETLRRHFGQKQPIMLFTELKQWYAWLQKNIGPTKDSL